MNKIYVFEKVVENGSILYLTQNIIKAFLFKRKHQDFEYWTVKGKKQISNFFYDFQLQETTFSNIIIL
jgi:hypothetical protein